MPKLLSVSIPDDLSASLDAVASAEGQTRSEVVRDALRGHLWQTRWRQMSRTTQALAQARGIGPEDVEGLIDELRAGR